MMIGAGMTSAIMKPLHAEDQQAIAGADVVMGNDPNCGRWIKKFREPAPEGAASADGARVEEKVRGGAGGSFWNPSPGWERGRGEGACWALARVCQR